MGKRAKYGNKKTVIDGLTFDSKAEAHRYGELNLMQRAGAITDLQRQVAFELVPKQMKYDGTTERACVYKADFLYTDKAGRRIVEDVKGVRTPDYVIKRKLLLHVHGIEITEVKA